MYVVHFLIFYINKEYKIKLLKLKLINFFNLVLSKFTFSDDITNGY